VSREWLPEELDLESDQIRQVFAVYGAAMYFAQVLEHGLVNVVMVSRAGTYRSHEEADAVWEELFASTMGRQLRDALAEGGLSEALVDRLRNALRTRNYLAHEFWRERSDHMGSFTGRNELLVELEEMRAELHASDRELEPITRGIFAAKGVTEKMFEAEVAGIMAKAYARDEPVPGQV
jgi:hypothetical protein